MKKNSIEAMVKLLQFTLNHSGTGSQRYDIIYLTSLELPTDIFLYSSSLVI